MRQHDPPINGRAINVAAPRITPEGREFLEQLRNPPQREDPDGKTEYDRTLNKLKNRKPLVVIMIAAVAIVAIVGFIDAVMRGIELFKGLVK
jgi:hypothetical protein